jgi:uncharacterized protein (TIGR03790 family)
VFKPACSGPALARAAALFAAIAITAPLASAQTVDNLLVVTNDASADSREVAAYYAAKRSVPESQVVHISVDPTDEVSRADYESKIERPLASWIAREGAYDRILYIVLTKGVPIRIQGTTGGAGTSASVDSELTLLYRRLIGGPVSPNGPLPNPYFLAAAPVGDARPFSHERQDIYLVTRLDGYTVGDVKALIDRSVAPARAGSVVLDMRSGADIGDKWMQDTAERLKTAAPNVLVDVGVAAPSSAREDVLGYYSWGSNDPAIHARRPVVSFANGALAATFVAGDARTFAEPPADWKLGRWGDASTYFGGSPASLTGDLIRHGVTGAAGSVGDPYLEGSVRPSVLFPAYLSGRNLAESFYLAMPFISWQMVVIGDPLCMPFQGVALKAEEASPAADSVTEFSAYFSARRVDLLSLSGIKFDALKLFLRGESRLRAKDPAGARQALEESTTIDDRLVPAHSMLASVYETLGEYDKAAERYRKVLAYAPADAMALNNLAYSIAVRQGQPKDALPLAEKAYDVTNGNPSIADTLGWIHHLLGDDAAATPLVTRAAERLTQSAEVQLHAATVLAAVGQRESASAALTRAITLDAALETRQDVQQLRLALAAADATATP